LHANHRIRATLCGVARKSTAVGEVMTLPAAEAASRFNPAPGRRSHRASPAPATVGYGNSVSKARFRTLTAVALLPSIGTERAWLAS
jgi:hypothetical protein